MQSVSTMKSLYLRMILTLCLVCVGSSSYAMGSGDKFTDAQTGLTYGVFKPSNTAGLSLTKFALLDCGVGSEQWIALQYGGKTKSAKQVDIYQTMAGAKCSNPGLAKKLSSITIQGSTAAVYVYCDPSQPKSFKACSSKDIAKVGGYLMFTLNAPSGLRKTEIQVQGIHGITYSQLVAIAKSLQPIMKASTRPMGMGGSSQVIPPVMIDPTTFSGTISLPMTNLLVFTVVAPSEWQATIDDPAVAEFVPGGDQGGYTTNPGVKPLKPGNTLIHLKNAAGEEFEIAIEVK